MNASRLDTAFTRQVGVRVPLICGAMYPCSNPELVAAASAAGAMGVLQPTSMVYVHGHEFEAGLKFIRSITSNPIGMNVIAEKSVAVYRERMERWIDMSLEGGVRFFVTSLGNPRWIIERVAPVGGIVYHDVTERKWALKARDVGAHGLIAVNKRAGGHAGTKTAEELLDELGDLGLPLVCAGGIGDEEGFVRALDMGYAAVQMGTRFIATDECRVHDDYKQAILRAGEDDIVLTEKVTGVPLAVINTPYIARMGTKASWIARRMLRGHRTKHLMRLLYTLQSAWKLKHSAQQGSAYSDYFQAGRSVAGISVVEPVAAIVERFAAAAGRD
jgi:nitronate monooxygenase